jgi:hypothetical protein
MPKTSSAEKKPAGAEFLGETRLLRGDLYVAIVV